MDLTVQDLPDNTLRLSAVNLVISDTHFGDDLSWSGAPKGHERRVLREIASLMKPVTGTVRRLYHLGDVASSHLTRREQHLWLARLAHAAQGGQVVITRGNHDKLSEADYAFHGLELVEAAVVSGCYLSHRGTRILPDDARMQVLGHYHNRAPNPELPHAFKFDLMHEDWRPVSLQRIVQRSDRAGIRRELPERVDDCWNVPRDERGRKLKVDIDPNDPTGNIP